MSKIQMPYIEFNLSTLSNRDEKAGAWVGYIPMLRLFSQASDEESLGKALRQTALSFIWLCWSRKILDKVLRERGMRKRSAEEVEKAKEAKGQYIIVGGQIQQDAYQDVPIELLAGKQAQIECQR